MSLNVSGSISPNASISTSGLGTLTPSLNVQLALTDGTGANQANLVYFAQRSVTSGAADSLDLNGGGLLQPDQSAFNAVNVVAIFITNVSGGGYLTIGGGSNAIANVTGRAILGETFVKWAPGATAYPVTAGSADILKIDASSGTVVYNIMILARNA